MLTLLEALQLNIHAEEAIATRLISKRVPSDNDLSNLELCCGATMKVEE